LNQAEKNQTARILIYWTTHRVVFKLYRVYKQAAWFYKRNLSKTETPQRRNFFVRRQLSVIEGFHCIIFYCVPSAWSGHERCGTQEEGCNPWNKISSVCDEESWFCAMLTEISVPHLPATDFRVFYLFFYSSRVSCHFMSRLCFLSVEYLFQLLTVKQSVAKSITPNKFFS